MFCGRICTEMCVGVCGFSSVASSMHPLRWQDITWVRNVCRLSCGFVRSALLFCILHHSAAVRLYAQDAPTAQILDSEICRPFVDRFNSLDEEQVVNDIPNAESRAWMQQNIPWFDCPDNVLKEIYYYRWWTYRKHIKRTPDGFVVTEFLRPVRHAGTHNTISCALGHHLYEGRWLHEQDYMNEYVHFWLHGDEGRTQPHLHRYSNWIADAVIARHLVQPNPRFLIKYLDDLVENYRRWERERQSDDGLFWQYDVRDGMEESISGSRTRKNQRPTINSYMYAESKAIAFMATVAGKTEVADEFAAKAARLRQLVQDQLWDSEAQFFKVRLEDGSLSDARELIGYIPWYFGLPVPGFEAAWRQLTDPDGFWAPCGITTAERRHPKFRTHGTGRSCEWDGAVWPYATSQTLVALANLLRDYPQSSVTRADYFEALQSYARIHYSGNQPYIGEYLDEVTGHWMTDDEEQSRYYNHSTFADLVITGLVGLRPRTDETIEVDPLVPPSTWDWFCLDHVPYHGRTITILWDRTGLRYQQGPGFRILVDGKENARTTQLERLTGTLTTRSAD